MKLSVALSLVLAPVALASAIQNSYPVRRGDSKDDSSSKDSGKDSGKSGSKGYNSGSGKNYGGLIVGSLEEIIVIWVNGGGGGATTTVNSVQTVTQTVTAGASGSTVTAAAAAAGGSGSSTAAAAAATHTVTVGGAKGLVYEPDSISANVGDMVIFTFLSQNHTVSQSAFATPCELLAGGMDSGFQPNPNNTVNPPPQVALQVMVSTPLWFYCRQKGHCGKGMVFSINPTANKTQAAFQQMAIAQNGTGSASAITGGGSSSGSGSGSGSSNGSTTAAAAAAAATTTAAAAAASAPAAAASSAATTVSVATTASVAAAAASASSSSSGTGIVVGSGSVNADGSCACVVQCSFGSFPAVQAQGLGAFGGFAGAMPSSAVPA